MPSASGSSSVGVPTIAPYVQGSITKFDITNSTSSLSAPNPNTALSIEVFKVNELTKLPNCKLPPAVLGHSPVPDNKKPVFALKVVPVD